MNNPVYIDLNTDCTADVTTNVHLFELFIAVYFNVICCTLPEYEDSAETFWFYVIESTLNVKLCIYFCYQSINIYRCTQ